MGHALGAAGVTCEPHDSPGMCLRLMGQMFVTVWMKVGPQKPAAYELLVKLCAAKLAEASKATDTAGHTVFTDPRQSAMLAQVSFALAAAIACRNEMCLPT